MTMRHFATTLVFVGCIAPIVACADEPAKPLHVVVIGDSTAAKPSEAVGAQRPRSDAELVNAFLSELTIPDRLKPFHPQREVKKLGLNAKTVAPALIRLLQDSNSSFQHGAAEALADLGYCDAAVRTALARAMESRDHELALCAAGSLALLDPKNRQPVSFLIETYRAALAKVTKFEDESDKEEQETEQQNLRDQSTGELQRVGRVAIPMLVKTLTDKDRAMRVMAAEVLGEIGDNSYQTVPALIRSLGDKSSAVRRKCAWALGRFDEADKTMLPALRLALKDSDPTVAMHAACSMALIVPSSKRPWRFLHAQLHSSKDRELQSELLYAMGRIGRPAIPLLKNALKHKDEGVQIIAAQVLLEIDPKEPASVPAVLAALKNQDCGYFECSVAESIHRSIWPSVSELIDVLKNAKTHHGRYAAARMLAPLGTKAKPAIPVLIQLLRTPFKPAGGRLMCGRDMMIRALVAIGPDKADRPAAARALLSTLKTTARYKAKSPPPRGCLLFPNITEYHAIQALERLGPAARPQVVAAMKDKDPFYRQYLANALARLGADAKDIVPVVVKGLVHPNAAVAYAARRAVSDIGHERPRLKQPFVGALLRKLKSTDLTQQQRETLREIVESFREIET